MATFPSGIISFTDPASTNFLNSPPHATQHANENDEIVAIETKIGINGSADTNSLDYKINHIVINRGFGFFVPGTVSIANDQSWDPTSPQAMTAIKIWAYAQIGPVGSSLTVQIYNITQSHAVASVSITTGNTTGNSTSMTNAAIAAGDVLRCDITAIGSSTAGANISIILECTQP